MGKSLNIFRIVFEIVKSFRGYKIMTVFFFLLNNCTTQLSNRSFQRYWEIFKINLNIQLTSDLLKKEVKFDLNKTIVLKPLPLLHNES